MLSYADLIQLGGYAAVEYCGGPAMLFRMGREDATEHDLAPEDRLPSPHEPKPSMLQKMLRLGYTKRDFVAIMGSHTIGFAHMERSGFQGRWTQNPHVFDNTYYTELMLGEKSKYLKTPGEWMLLGDQEMKNLVE
jgi:L-ascorbate peroxidase